MIVYYYTSGSWREANPNVSRALGGTNGNVGELVERCQRMGYHAHDGIAKPRERPTCNGTCAMGEDCAVFQDCDDDTT